eukprot:tig00001177_g7362.t1
MGLHVKGAAGTALKFDLLSNGTLLCDDYAVHQERPVTQGLKRMMLVWLLAPLEWMETLEGPAGYDRSFALTH